MVPEKKMDSVQVKKKLRKKLQNNEKKKKSKVNVSLIIIYK